MIFVADGKLDDFASILAKQPNPISKLGWYVSQSELVHEILHEFQYKRISKLTAAGEQLFAKHGHRFPDPGTTNGGFTAIADRAHTLDSSLKNC